MVVECPQCRARYRLDPTRLRGGRGRLQCARCKNVFPVSAPSDADAPRPRPTSGDESAADGARAAVSAVSKRQRSLLVGLVALPPGPFRQLVVGCLARAGVRSVSLDHGAEAVDVARRSRPAIVVAHAALRHLTAAEVFAELRDDPALAATRLVLVGGPEASGRYLPSPAAVAGADARLPDDATAPQIESLVRRLLGTEPGAVEAGKLDAVDRWARVAARDLVDAGGEPLRRRLARDRDEATASVLEPLRGAALDAFPSASSAHRSATVEKVDRAVEAALDELSREP